MFDLGHKQVIINSLDKFILSFINKDTPTSAETVVTAFADQAAINATEIMNLNGYAKINKTKIRNLTGSRGQQPAKQANILRMEHGGSSTAFTPGIAVKVELQFESINFESELSSGWSQTFGRPKSFNFNLYASTNATQSKEFVQTLAKHMLLEQEWRNGESFLYDFELGTYNETTFAWSSLGKPTLANLASFTTADAILIKSTSGSIRYKVYSVFDRTQTAKITNIATYAATDTAIANSAVVIGNEGKNTIEQMRKIKLQTDNNIWAYSNQMDTLPGDTTTYAVFTFDQLNDRNDLPGNTVVNGVTQSQTKFALYINEALTITVGSVTDYAADIIGTFLSSAGALVSERHEGLVVAGSLVSSATTWDTANIRIN